MCSVSDCCSSVCQPQSIPYIIKYSAHDRNTTRCSACSVVTVFTVVSLSGAAVLLEFLKTASHGPKQEFVHSDKRMYWDFKKASRSYVLFPMTYQIGVEGWQLMYRIWWVTVSVCIYKKCSKQNVHWVYTYIYIISSVQVINSKHLICLKFLSSELNSKWYKKLKQNYMY